MGTSLSGLTPATTFDGLLKTSDNQPLDGTLKAISTGDGTDTMLELSTTALQIGGATGMYWNNTNKRLGIGTDNPSATFEVYGAARFRSNVNVNGRLFNSANGRLNLNNLVYIQSNVGIGESTATSRLHIKGSGATSATTSLLVQNSAGTDMFKVVDDNTMFYHTHKFRSAGGYLYIEGEGNADRSLKVGQNFTASSYDGHIFKTYDGSAYSEAMRITGANDQLVGIGETTPTARLHVKGSGNGNTTTSLLVQNSDGTDLFKITDDRDVYLGSSTSNYIHRGVFFQGDYYATGDWNFGTVSDLGARLGIKGSGATSATTALLVQNSAGTELMSVDDDGDVNIPDTAKISALTHVSNKITGTSVRLQATSGYLSVSRIASAAPADTLFYVQGAGNDNTTTALLVQNSDGDDMLKVGDDGRVLVDEYIYPADGTTNSRFRVSNSGGTYMYYSTGNLKLNPNLVYTSTTYGTVFTVGASTGDFNINGATGAKMAIKGNGATSATTALLVQNSAGTDLLKVNDAGNIFMANNAFQIQTSQMVSYRPGIFGGAGRNASAVLQAESTTQGFLPPRMTETERDAISSPAAGLMIYNTTTNTAECWNGSAWMPMF